MLEALLDKYADAGVGQIEETQIFTVVPFTEFVTPIEIVRAFGELDNYQKAIRDLKESLYSVEYLCRCLSLTLPTAEAGGFLVHRANLSKPIA